MWILTEAHNDYNQHGQYFIYAWLKKPTIEQLREQVGYNDAGLEFILQGGGRRGTEEVWYYLEEFTVRED